MHQQHQHLDDRRWGEFEVILGYTEILRLAWAIRDTIQNKQKQCESTKSLLYAPFFSFLR